MCHLSLKSLYAVLAHLFNSSKSGYFRAGLTVVMGHRDSDCVSLPVLERISFSTWSLSSLSGRGPPADAFCWDLWFRCSLLAAWSDWRFCREGPHGVGARSFRDCHQSGSRSDTSETRWLEWILSFKFFCFPESALITGCAFPLQSCICFYELWVTQSDPSLRVPQCYVSPNLTAVVYVFLRNISVPCVILMCSDCILVQVRMHADKRCLLRKLEKASETTRITLANNLLLMFLQCVWTWRSKWPPAVERAIGATVWGLTLWPLQLAEMS